MEFLSEFLPILLYIAGIVLLIVLIILGIKCIRILNHEEVVDDVQEKIDSFDGAISVFSKAANGVAGISNSIVSVISSVVSKLIKKGKEEDDVYE